MYYQKSLCKNNIEYEKRRLKKIRLLNAYFQTCPVLNGAPIYLLILSLVLLQPSYRSESAQQEQLFQCNERKKALNMGREHKKFFPIIQR